MTMISAIKNSEIPVATIVEGKAMSCGAVLLTFGEDGMRFADPDATVMIHDVLAEDVCSSWIVMVDREKKTFSQLHR